MANKKQDDMTLQAIVDRDVLGMLDNHFCKRITMTHFAMQLCVNAAAGLSDTHTHSKVYSMPSHEQYGMLHDHHAAVAEHSTSIY